MLNFSLIQTGNDSSAHRLTAGQLILLALPILLLTSCTAPDTRQPAAPTQIADLSSPAAPAPALTLTPASLSTPTPVPPGADEPAAPITAGFVDPEPGIRVDLRPAVREYFYYRKKAIVSSDVSVLWERFPHLEQGMDTQAGINIEKNAVKNYGVLKPFDGNIFPEYYEQIKVKMSGDSADVLVHGMELYLFLDDSGKFEESGGEFRIILSLKKQNNLWTVYKTTDISGP